MKIIVNGKEAEIPSNQSISVFLENRGIKPETVVVEHNFQLPPRSEWSDILLSENDNLEVIKIIGGG